MKPTSPYISDVIPDSLVVLHDPEDGYPIFPGLTIWKYYPLRSGARVFPTIEPPTIVSIDYPQQSMGQDFDGSFVGIVLDGPEMGRTFIHRTSRVISIH